jgi:hypothetical protein
MLGIGPVRRWNIVGKYLIFRLESGEGEQAGNFIHIVDLENDNAYIRIKDFTDEPDCKICFPLFLNPPDN